MNEFKVPTKEEVKALGGAEFIYRFTEDNGPDLEGHEVPAYVAHADLYRGITIKGTIPEHMCEAMGVTPEEEVVLQCCSTISTQLTKEYLIIVRKYITHINSGVFTVIGGSGGDVKHMNDACAF